jgi:pyruvate dehydrogenase E2 component (dihydrolipoamide acetyltransferase)
MVRISPLARKTANEHGVDVTGVVGSGPGSRIVQADIKRILEHPLEIDDGPRYVDIPPSRIRMLIAEKLTRSKQDVPHFYLSVTADVTALMRMREEINGSNIVGTKITVNDLIIRAVALAVSTHQDVNVSWCNGRVRTFKTVDIAVAVSVDGGIVTPVIENADRKELVEISNEIKHLTQLARTRSLTLQQMTGGGITVSNLGMYGISRFFAIINSDQGSILSVGKASKVPVYNEHNELVAAHMLEIGYSVDHRVIDGAVAAEFLASLVTYLQAPTSLLLR